jgi:hypothetical protein
MAVPSMSALGQKRTCAVQKRMSALPQIADMCGATRDVRFVPKADITRFHFYPSAKKLRLAAQLEQNSFSQ